MLDKAKVTLLPALAQGLGSFEINIVQVPVIDNVAVAEHPTEALQQIPFPELVPIQALGAFEMEFIRTILLTSKANIKRTPQSHIGITVQI